MDWLDDGYATTAPVGRFRPNAFGLHDVGGNLQEWCRDTSGMYGSTPVDGSAHETGDPSTRITRGGCWLNSTELARSASRVKHEPGSSFTFIGLRPVYRAR